MMSEMGKKKIVKIFSAAVAFYFCLERCRNRHHADRKSRQCRAVEQYRCC